MLNVLYNYENINDFFSFQFKCCCGFVVDLLNKFVFDLEFEYVLYIVYDMIYGKEKNGIWDGMMRDLINGIVYMVIVVFSIIGNRLCVIDFFYLYYFLCFIVLYIQQSQKIYMYVFLELFFFEVWCIIFVSVSLLVLGMFMFEWNSLFGLNFWGRKCK